MTLAREEQRRVHPCHDAEHVIHFLCGVQWLEDVPSRYLTTSVFRVQQPHRQATWSDTHHVMVGRPVMPDHDSVWQYKHICEAGVLPQTRQQSAPRCTAFCRQGRSDLKWHVQRLLALIF